MGVSVWESSVTIWRCVATARRYDSASSTNQRKRELALVAFLQKTFGVPLYADDAFLFVTLDGFYDAVGRISRRAEAFSGVGHCLVVHGVNRKAFAEQASDDGIRFGRHIVRWYAARHFLVVFEEQRRFGHSCAQILVHCSAERYG